MVAKKTGISRDLIIHPGETIADILETRSITQTELAARTGVSPAYVSKVISGKKDISSKFAMALEYALDVPKSFWLNLQANYEAELLDFNESNTITEDERDAYGSLSEVASYFKKCGRIPGGMSKNGSILLMRKILCVSNLTNLNDLVVSGAFRVSQKATVNPLVMGAWLQLCQIIGNQISAPVAKFDVQRVPDLIGELKKIMLNKNADLRADLENVMSRYGIKFAVIRNFRGAPVHGYISRNKDGMYQMITTIRGAYADIFWFSLFHELGHIVNGDIAKDSDFIDVSDGLDLEKERAADIFAQDSLLEPKSYADFLQRGDFTLSAISNYANTQNVMPYVVIGRLQKEKHISYSAYSDYKVRYGWANQ